MSRPPRTSDQVHRLGLLVNLGLAAIKLVSGGLSGSRAVFADGVHSLADVVTAAVVWLGYRWSRRPPDEDHHYGHENGESLAAVLVGGLVVATGVGLVVAGVTGAGAASPDLFGVLALSAEGLTVAVKLWLAKVTRRAGEASGSPSLTALSHDNRADAWTSALVLASVLASVLGGPAWAEGVATALVGALIVRMGVRSLRDGIGVLMDRVDDPTLRARIVDIAAQIPGVRRVASARVHPLGGSLRVDLEIDVAGELEVAQGHALAHRVEEAITAALPRVRGVHVHVQPAAEPSTNAAI